MLNIMCEARSVKLSVEIQVMAWIGVERVSEAGSILTLMCWILGRMLLKS